MTYEVNAGDGAFYGPKIDFKLKDALKRKWQCATIQCDFTLPERFDLSYVGEDGEKHRPVMLHRVILGAIERFMACLSSTMRGFSSLAVAGAGCFGDCDRETYPLRGGGSETTPRGGIRVEGDFRNEKLGYKIREAQMQKTPYMLVIGDRK